MIVGGASQSADEGPGSWKPTGQADHWVVVLAGLNQTLILVTVLHLVWSCNWPPYVVKDVSLVCVTGIAGACWSISLISSFGVYERQEGTFWSQCDVEIFLSWFSLGLLCNASFLRVYRHWQRLRRHARKMWQTEWQILTLMVPFLIPSIFYLCRPDLLHFDPVTQECASEYCTITPIMGVYCMGLLLLGLYLVYSMRLVRKQFNEFENVRSLAVAIVLAPVLFLLVNAISGPEHGKFRRRMEVSLSIVITGIIFWTPVYAAVWAFIVKDEEYLDIYAHGFYQLPTPAQVRATSPDKLTVEELRHEFQHYAQRKVAPELSGFYGAVLDRDEVQDYFERQAVTMHIMDHYVREGAPLAIGLSEECRRQVLHSDVTKIDIFEEARVEVLQLIQRNYQRFSDESAAYHSLRIFRRKPQKQFVIAGLRTSPVAHPPGLEHSQSGVDVEQGRLAPPCDPGESLPSPDDGGSLCYSSDGCDAHPRLDRCDTVPPPDSTIPGEEKRDSRAISER